MITFTWNSSFESRPGIGLNRNALDNELRLIAQGVRERMEREHNWGPYTDKDDGTHIPGKTTVLGIGSYANRTSYSNPQEGALYVAEDEGESGNMQIYIYYNSDWHKISELDHGSLTNLTDVGAHTMYLLKTGGTVDGKIAMGGNDLILSSYSGGIGSGFVVGQHMGLCHTMISDVCIPDGEITLGKLKISNASYSGTINNNSQDDISLSSYYVFLPNLYASTRADHLTMYPLSDGTIRLNNRHTLLSSSYRLNLTLWKIEV